MRTLNLPLSTLIVCFLLFLGYNHMAVGYAIVDDDRLASTIGAHSDWCKASKNCGTTCVRILQSNSCVGCTHALKYKCVKEADATECCEYFDQNNPAYCGEQTYGSWDPAQNKCGTCTVGSSSAVPCNKIPNSTNDCQDPPGDADFCNPP